jgi:hypothetical protein
MIKKELIVEIKESFNNEMNIVKTELFDENVLAHLKSIDMLECDRKILNKYLKNDKSVGKRKVQYKLSSYSHNLGRLYPDKGLSLGCMRWDIRNPVCYKYYWDIDFVNCQMVILYNEMKQMKLPTNTIEKFVNNRDEILTMINNDRDIAKKVVLKVLYGGCNDFLGELSYEDLQNLDLELAKETKTLIDNLKNEIYPFKEYIWTKYSHLHDKRVGNCILNKRPNPKCSMLSLHLQTIERELLLLLDNFLFENNRHLDVLIHDGGYVRKLPNENYFPENLLRQAEKYIFDKSGIDIKLKQKEITHNFNFNEINELKVEFDNVEYQNFKLEFEEKYFYHNDNSCFYKIISTGEVVEVSEKSINNDIHKKMIKWKFQNGDIQNVSFLSKWIEDKKRKNYNRIDFKPKFNNNDPMIYDQFLGYELENYIEKNEIDEIEQLEICDKFTETKVYTLMYEILSNSKVEYFDWLCYWFYHLLFTPYKPVEVCPVFVGRQGIGKSSLFRFLKNIIGIRYFVELGSVSALLQKHNDFLTFKTLILVNEFDTKDLLNQDNTNLKSIITDQTIKIEPKGKKTMMLNNSLHSMFASNEKIFPVPEDNRRFGFYECNDKYKGNVEFFEKYSEQIQDKNIQIYFYYYIKKYYSNKFDFVKNFPKSNLLNNIKEVNLSYNEPHIDFIKTLLTENQYEDDVYKLFGDGDDYMKKCEFFDLYCKVISKNTNDRLKGISKVKFNIELNKINEKNADIIDKTETGFKSVKNSSGFYCWRLYDVNKFVNFVQIKYNILIDTPYYQKNKNLLFNI